MTSMIRNLSTETQSHMSQADKVWNSSRSAYYTLDQLEADNVPCQDRRPTKNVVKMVADPTMSTREKAKALGDALCHVLRGGYSESTPVFIEQQSWPQDVVFSWGLVYAALYPEPEPHRVLAIEALIRHAYPRLVYAVKVATARIRQDFTDPGRVNTWLIGSIISHASLHRPPPSLVPPAVPPAMLISWALAFTRISDSRGLTLSKTLRARLQLE